MLNMLSVPKLRQLSKGLPPNIHGLSLFPYADWISEDSGFLDRIQDLKHGQLDQQIELLDQKVEVEVGMGGTSRLWNLFMVFTYFCCIVKRIVMTYEIISC